MQYGGPARWSLPPNSEFGEDFLMLMLVLAVACSVIISVGMRVSARYVRHRMAMFAVNYAVCLLLSRLFMGSLPLLTAQPGIGTAAALGAVSGLLYLVSFMLLQRNIRESGMVLSSASMKLGGVLVPVLVSVLFFGGALHARLIFGTVLALAAILLMNLEPGSLRLDGLKSGLLCLLLCSGVTDTMASIYDQAGAPAFRNHYLFFTFLAALVIALGLALYKKEKPQPADLLFGVLIGVPNYFSSRFLLLSLAEVPAVVAYPVFSIGTLLFISLIGISIFHEQLSRRKLCAMVLIVLALFLLNAAG